MALVKESYPEEISLVKEKQKKFFASQKTKPLPFRLQQLRTLKKALKVYEKDLIKSLRLDLGKHENEAYMTEIGYLYRSLDLAIKKLPAWAKKKRLPTPYYLWPGKSYIGYEPYGTVLIIGPFNYPLQLVLEPLLGAISAGNTAIIKPSELTPYTSELIEKLVKNYFDPAYVACFLGGVETTTRLLALPFDLIFFTGSPRVGRIVMKAAAENLSPLILELGGKSPAIVDSSARLDTAARRIIWGKTLNAGQTCIAPDYVLVEESSKEAFIGACKRAIKDFYGDQIQDNPDYGKIVNQAHFDRLVQILERDRDYLVYGGQAIQDRLYIQPSLLDLPGPAAASMEEEIFGPILPILTYSNLGEVFDLVGSRPKPLSLYLFSQDQASLDKVLGQISSGGVSINDTISHVANPHLPFGGVGNSGMGAYHGQDNFRAFSHQKSIYHRAAGLENGLKSPPFTKGQLNLIKKIFKP